MRAGLREIPSMGEAWIFSGPKQYKILCLFPFTRERGLRNTVLQSKTSFDKLMMFSFSQLDVELCVLAGQLWQVPVAMKMRNFHLI